MLMGSEKRKKNFMKTKFKDNFTAVLSYYGSDMSLFSSSLNVKKRGARQNLNICTVIFRTVIVKNRNKSSKTVI
jgi:hypothetical protein